MTSIACPECSACDWDDNDVMGAVMCTACGYVAAESVIETSGFHNSSLRDSAAPTTTPVYRGESGGGIPPGLVATRTNSVPVGRLLHPRDRENKRRQRLWSFMLGLAPRLHLPRTVFHQAQNLVERLLDDTWRAGRKTDLKCIACLYIAARLNKRTLTLIDMADYAQVNVFELGRVYTRCLAALDIQLPAVDLQCYLQRIVSNLPVPDASTVLAGVVDSASRLIDLAKSDWIATGRRPAGIAAAALWLALQASSPPSVTLTVDQVAASFNVTARCIDVRVRELSEALITQAAEPRDLSLPLTPAQLRSMLSALPNDLKNSPKADVASGGGSSSGVSKAVDLDATESAATPSSSSALSPGSASSPRTLDPPAFRRVERDREQRRLKVQQAKQRLHATLTGKKRARDRPLDDEDLRIERALLAGHPEYLIIQGSYEYCETLTMPSVSQSEHVGDLDLSPREEQLYLRSPSEVKQARALADAMLDVPGSAAKPKRPRVS